MNPSKLRSAYHIAPEQSAAHKTNQSDPHRLERQREGIARAKAEGKYKGRVPTAQRQAARAIAMRQEGQKPEAIASELGISRASVFRVLKAGCDTAAVVGAETATGGRSEKV